MANDVVAMCAVTSALAHAIVDCFDTPVTAKIATVWVSVLLTKANHLDKNVAAAVIIVLVLNAIVYPAYSKWQQLRVPAVPEEVPT